MPTIADKPKRMKVVYNRTVGIEGIVKRDGKNHVAISTDNGDTWSVIHKDDVRSATPIK